MWYWKCIADCLISAHSWTADISQVSLMFQSHLHTPHANIQLISRQIRLMLHRIICGILICWLTDAWHTMRHCWLQQSQNKPICWKENRTATKRASWEVPASEIRRFELFNDASNNAHLMQASPSSQNYQMWNPFSRPYRVSELKQVLTYFWHSAPGASRSLKPKKTSNQRRSTAIQVLWWPRLWVSNAETYGQLTLRKSHDET